LITGILHFKVSPSAAAPDVVSAKLSSVLSSANKVNQDDHDGDDQQNMNETTHGV